jgi:4-hydroxy-tetrahydrodipicolinate synthase
MPHECVELFNAAVKQKDFSKASEINKRIQAIGELTERSGKFVQYCKYGVELVRGEPVSSPRMPLLPLSEEEKHRLREHLTAASIPIAT